MLKGKKATEKIVNLFCIALIIFSPLTSLNAGWISYLEEVKAKWQAIESRCIDCGKKIHGRDLCTNCAAKRLQVKIEEDKQKNANPCSVCGKTIYTGRICLTCSSQKGIERIQETVQKTEGICKTCGKVIHGRNQCTTCVANQVKSKYEHSKSKLAHNCCSCGKIIHFGNTCGDCMYKTARPITKKIIEDVEKWASTHVVIASKFAEIGLSNYGESVKSFTDQNPSPIEPEYLAGAMWAFKREMKSANRKTLEDVMREIVSHPVKLADDNWSTLEAEAEKFVLEKDSWLLETDLIQDPAMPIVALMFKDRKYFINEFRFIHADSGVQSFKEYFDGIGLSCKEKYQESINFIINTDNVSKGLSTGNIDFESSEKVFNFISDKLKQ